MGPNMLLTHTCFLGGKVQRNTLAGYTKIKVFCYSTLATGKSGEKVKPKVLASRTTMPPLATRS